MKVSIVFFNDVHGYMEEHPELFYEGSREFTKAVGGYSRLYTFIRSIQRKNKNTLVFDGGDTFHGTYPVVETKGEILVPLINQLDIAAMVGHWDFGYGPKQLQQLASQLNYPILGINVYQENGELLFAPYEVKEIEGLKVGIIGICSNIIDKTMPERFSEDIRVTNGMEEMPVYIKKLRAEGVNIIILLSHNGFPQDCEMLSKTEGVDICLSAHTHNRLYEVVTINNTRIIQCGCHGSFAGHLDMDIEKYKVVSCKYELVEMDNSIAQDDKLEKQVQDALEPYRFLQEQIGNTPSILHRYNSMNSSLDNLLLAAIANSAGCSIAFSNGWRYGAPIAKGPVTLNALYNIIPMNPPVSTVEITGKEMRQMLEENIERTFSSAPMKQMGGYLKRCYGISVHVKIENPIGYRIQELLIGNKPYEDTAVYKVAFVTEQGVPKKYGKNRINLAVKAVDTMAAFLREDLLTDEVIHAIVFKNV